MRDPRRQAFAPYVRDLADRMGMKDWAFVVEDCGPQSTADASVWLANAQRCGRIFLSDRFLDSTREEQRASVVHELVHPHLEPGWEIGVESLPESVRGAFNKMMEYGVDSIARAWAETLPLPPKATNRK